MSHITKTASILFIAVVVFLILFYGRSLMVPFILALLTWFLIRQVLDLVDRIGFVRKHFPQWLKNLFVSLAIFALLGFVAKTLSDSIKVLINSYAQYQENLSHVFTKMNTTLGPEAIEYLKNFAGAFNFGELLSAVFNAFTSLLGSAFLVVLYVVFIFIEESFFQPKLKAIFPNPERFEKIDLLLNRIGHSITHYVGLKSLMSLITGTISYFIIMAIGIDSPAFWAFLIFLLNFIPNIGSLVATAFPAIFALIQFGEFLPFFLVIILVTLVQVAVGNFLEPRVMGNALNISPLVTILALSFWGILWGITGMLLSVPITVMMVIVFAQFTATRPVAILLSKTGEVGKSL